jgi:hypothetical protein
LARRRSLDGGVWARRGVLWWDLGFAADADAGVLGLARWTAARFHRAPWSGAFLCLLVHGRTMLLLRHLLVGDEGGGRVPDSSVVATW